MSVLIKGMEMPKCCAECSFLQESVWKLNMYPCVCVAGDFVVKPSETDMRDGLCPLVEVPTSHGRLIDVDKLEVVGLKDYEDAQKVAFAINNAPAVIESEEE